MLVIDPDGIASGDRMRKLSDIAKLHFNIWYIHSNSCGRIELNYFRVIGECYPNFKNPPTEEQFWKLAEEFNQAFLLFIYQADDGGVWGQWDTLEKYLPKYKSAKDLASPAPRVREFADWRNQYVQSKAARNTHARKDLRVFGKCAEIATLAVAVADNIAVDVASKKQRASGDAQGSQMSLLADCETRERAAVKVPETADSLPEIPLRKDADGLTPQQANWFSEWWQIYWLHKAKREGRRAFGKSVRDQLLFERVMESTRAQIPEMRARDPSKRPYPSTWLLGKRWEDELLTRDGREIPKPDPKQSQEESIERARELWRRSDAEGRKALEEIWQGVELKGTNAEQHAN